MPCDILALPLLELIVSTIDVGRVKRDKSGCSCNLPEHTFPILLHCFTLLLYNNQSCMEEIIQPQKIIVIKPSKDHTKQMWQFIAVTITEMVKKYTVLKEEFLLRVLQLKTFCVITIVLSTTPIIPNRLHESSKLLNFRSGLYILLQKRVILNTRRVVRKVWHNSE